MFAAKSRSNRQLAKIYSNRRELIGYSSLPSIEEENCRKLQQLLVDPDQEKNKIENNEPEPVKYHVQISTFVPLKDTPLTKIYKAHNLVLLGHSYVRDLRKSFGKLTHSTKFDCSLVRQQYMYYYAKPGSTFSDWNLNNWLFDLKNDLPFDNPLAIIIVLGGNDFAPLQCNLQTNPLKPIFASLKEFLINLSGLFPNTKILMTQVEQRCFDDKNKHPRSPPLDVYLRLAKGFNRYIERYHLVHKIVRVNEKTTGIVSRDCFRKDGVHLTVEGLVRYWYRIDCTLRSSLQE